MISPPIITLTTDFGSKDAYVGIVKGVILTIAPMARIVDISHAVEPQNVSEAAYLMRSAFRYFPAHTVHLVVVDPGVGTARKALAIETGHGTYIGPDNGVFTEILVAQDAVALPEGTLARGRAVELTNPAYQLATVSGTFHGRDVFAPAAAHLAIGVDLRELGPKVDTVRLLPRHRLSEEGDGIRGTIVHIDHFGNAISDLRRNDLPPRPVFSIGGRTIVGLSTTYQDAPETALIGSDGFVEVAVRNDSAASRFGIKPGDIVQVTSSS